MEYFGILLYLLYGHLVYFTPIWYILSSFWHIFRTFWYVYTKKNLATLLRTLSIGPLFN
jgi:hypothetical protein